MNRAEREALELWLKEWQLAGYEIFSWEEGIDPVDITVAQIRSAEPPYIMVDIGCREPMPGVGEWVVQWSWDELKNFDSLDDAMDYASQVIRDKE